MAVTQISQIQVRYGLQEDIGTLAGGEFAWAIDTQRLFIGNGSVSEGAPRAGMTEIMTGSLDITEILGNYTYRGLLGGYEVITGPDVSTPVIRTLQDKIDDFVNIRDYGVTSTGSRDDTAAFQQAIDETYNRKETITAQRTRRAIRLNGGTYRIDGELKIPPYATFIGEGKDSVKLLLNGPAAKFTTSTGGDASADINLGEYPRSVHFKGLTIQKSVDSDGLIIDGATDIVFEDVGFVGPRTQPTFIGNGSCVVIRSTSHETSGVYFNRCSFSGLGYAVYIEPTELIKNISFSGCRFNDLYSAIRMENDGDIRNVKISDSLFMDVSSTAIYGSTRASGIISMGNTFINCASSYNGDNVPSTVWEPIIVFQSDANYSFMDVFSRTPEMSETFPRISGDTYRYSYMSLDEYLGLGSSRYYAGRKFGVQDGASFNIPTAPISRGFINYSLKRGVDTRIGAISFSTTDSGLISWADDYTETADIGVSLSVSVDTVNNNNILLNGTTTAVGQITQLSFDIKTQL